MIKNLKNSCCLYKWTYPPEDQTNEAEKKKKNLVDELTRISIKRIKHNQTLTCILLRFQNSLSNTLASSQMQLFKFKSIKIK